MSTVIPRGYMRARPLHDTATMVTTTEAFATLTSTQLDGVAGGFSWNDAVDEGNRWGTAGALVGAGGGAVVGAIAGAPAGGVGAIPGAGIGAGLGGAALGAAGFVGGFGASTYRQLRGK